MLLLNGAGGSAADPILKNLGMEVYFAASSMDVTTLNDAGIDTTAGFPVTNSVKSGLSPAATVVTQGNSGSYATATGHLTIASTTGLTVGDLLYLSHASITDGVYRIASIVGAAVTLESDPFAAGGVDRTGISYEVAWRYAGTTGTAPIVSSSGGQLNYAKIEGTDGVGNSTQYSNTFYVRDAPTSPLTDFISIDSKAYTGQLTRQTAPALALLSGWTNHGGVSHVELANHSVQAANNFTWADGTTGEKTLSYAVTNGFLLSAGDGAKYSRLLLKSKSGAAVSYGVDMDITLDTSGPTLTIGVSGR